ncbi:uncharacterized protein L3040_000500 [Drepanopeziza brunnea f. sp. 'multigermtubi']|uniref:uncharacterized protein n=1 Tax=Drepanopeziza brunnea f. sp. 'multigermtubi' TaxID=698441 RepID=UPI00239AFBB8|nr:hypothetical protein L3040_000500 [Drepanopeziza brunnea f. sp. 'multigermtubi']
MASGIENLTEKNYRTMLWTLYTVAVFITVLRLAVRYFQMKRLLWDDAFAIFGLISFTVMVVLAELMCEKIYMLITFSEGGSLGPKYTETKQITDGIIDQLIMQFYFMMLFWTTLWSIKGSFLMFYRRLFTGTDGYMKWWWAVVAFTIATYIASVLTNVMVCLPLWRRFTLNTQDLCGVVGARRAIWVATTIDILSDIFIAMLPIRLLFQLRISTSQKLGVGGIFSLVGFIIAVAIVRMIYVLNSISTSDTRHNISVTMWSVLEAGVAVIVGSLPALKSLITKRHGNSTYGSSAKRYKHSGSSKTISSARSGPHKGPHIRLHDLPSAGTHNSIEASGPGWDSEDAIYLRSLDLGKGIIQTQEVSVHSHDPNQKCPEGPHIYSSYA